MKRFIAALLGVGVLLAAGCSNQPADGPVVPHPVTGKVIYDGKPAEGVIVALMPTDAPAPPRIPGNPHGTTAADGTFSITTFKENDGAAEGGYIVILNWPKPQPADGTTVTSEEDGDRLLGWYDAVHSSYQVRVKAGANRLPTFNLPKKTSPPPLSAGIPGRN